MRESNSTKHHLVANKLEGKETKNKIKQGNIIGVAGVKIEDLGSLTLLLSR